MVSHPLCMRTVPGSNPGESIITMVHHAAASHRDSDLCKVGIFSVRGSIVVSISACHADDPGSIPGRGSLRRGVCLEGMGRGAA